jgi:hypothetical protein
MGFAGICIILLYGTIVPESAKAGMRRCGSNATGADYFRKTSVETVGDRGVMEKGLAF